jgi:hypothetical protein
MQDGQLMTNRQLRERIRPERTPAIQASVISNGGGTRMFVAEMSAEQWENFVRRAGSIVDEMEFHLPDDPRQRQIEAARVPQLRRLLSLLEA